MYYNEHTKYSNFRRCFDGGAECGGCRLQKDGRSYFGIKLKTVTARKRIYGTLALPVVRLMSTRRGDINRARSSSGKQSKPEHNPKRIISPTSISGGMEASELMFIPLHVTHSANVN